MRAIRRIALIAAATAGFLCTLPSAFAADFSGEAEDDTVTIRGTTSRPGSASGVPAASTDTAPSTIVRNCVPIDDTGLLRCYTADTAAPDDAGIDAVTVDPETGLPSAQAIAAAVATELRRLPLRSGGITIQPGTGTTLVNAETIVLTDPTAQTFDVVVLGVPLTVVARPASYSWSFGDDTPPMTTTEPGAPWPNPTITHVYRTTGTWSITLTTEWTGTFRVVGAGAWQPIAGTAVTVETAPALEVREATNRLVTAP